MAEARSTMEGTDMINFSCICYHSQMTLRTLYRRFLSTEGFLSRTDLLILANQSVQIKSVQMHIVIAQHVTLDRQIRTEITLVLYLIRTCVYMYMYISFVRIENLDAVT